MPKALGIILIILGIILIILGVLLLLRIIPLSAPKITEAVVSKSVNKDTAEPVDVVSEFEADIPAVYCDVKAVQVRGGSVIKAEWYQVKYKLAESSLTVPGEKFMHYNSRFYFEQKKPEGVDWNSGNYEVKIYLDNNLSQTVSFKIKEEKGQASEAKIVSAITCKKVDENYAPMDKTDVFPDNINKICCSVQVSNAQKGAVIKAQWYNKDKDQLLQSSTYTVLKDHSAGYIAFSYASEGQKWDKGKYEVKIYVGNKLIKVAPFKIE